MTADEMAGTAQELLYQGSKGYVWVKRVEHNSKAGALLFFANPDPRKLHAVDVDGMLELEEGVAAVEAAADLQFCIFHGAYDPVHAGADITQFAGDCDYDAIDRHLYRGTDLDARVKLLWSKLRTVAILCGDRYGGSVEWPLFAEWAVCDQATRLQFSEVHLGIVPGWNGILNVLLKSNALNAKYMGQTGNPVDAADLKRMGLVQSLVDTPAAPDRRSIPPGEWAGVWAGHAAKCQEMLFAVALELAAQDEPPAREAGFKLVSEEELATEVARRTDPQPYLDLRAEVAKQTAALGDEPSQDDVKALGKSINKQLAGLGKPLAPAAVSGLGDYVGRWQGRPQAQLLAEFPQAGGEEAKLCSDLMHTEHRRRGINAILSRSLPDRVPVFD